MKRLRSPGLDSRSMVRTVFSGSMTLIRFTIRIAIHMLYTPCVYVKWRKAPACARAGGADIRWLAVQLKVRSSIPATARERITASYVATRTKYKAEYWLA